MNHIIIPRMSYGLDLNLVSFESKLYFPFSQNMIIMRLMQRKTEVKLV